MWITLTAPESPHIWRDFIPLDCVTFCEWVNTINAKTDKRACLQLTKAIVSSFSFVRSNIKKEWLLDTHTHTHLFYCVWFYLHLHAKSIHLGGVIKRSFRGASFRTSAALDKYRNGRCHTGIPNDVGHCQVCVVHMQQVRSTSVTAHILYCIELQWNALFSEDERIIVLVGLRPTRMLYASLWLVVSR